MAILAVCPYCHEGKVRAPYQAIGQSATCPRCQSCFTIVASNEVVKMPASSPAVPRPPISPAAPKPTPNVIADSPTPTPATASDTPMEVELPPRRAPAPMVAIAPIRDYSPPPPETSFLIGLVALIVAGIGFALSQVAYGRIAMSLVCTVGLMVGLAALFLAERKYLVPAIGTTANAIGLILVTFLPTWLGLKTWLPDRRVESPKIVKAVSYDGESALPAEWVDSSKAAWQQDDVRVSIKSTMISQIELSGPKDKKMWTKERYLQIWVQVKNSGVARPIEFGGWSFSNAPGAANPRITDSTGKLLQPKSFEGEFQPVGKPEGKSLFPGRIAEQMLLLELPDAKADSLRIELPGTPLGLTETVRLLVPRGSIQYRN